MSQCDADISKHEHHHDGPQNDFLGILLGILLKGVYPAYEVWIRGMSQQATRLDMLPTTRRSSHGVIVTILDAPY